jgi:ABC-type multidrug transport system fused ATPase/permease subunit
MWGVGDFFWYLLWIFYFTAYIFMVFLIISDLFRDHKLNGWWKAVWIIFLLFVPFLTALIYLIARGNSMAQRAQRDARQYQAATDDYIRGVAGASPADEIAKAKGLLDSGTITQGEYDLLKAKALAQPTQNV